MLALGLDLSLRVNGIMGTYLRLIFICFFQVSIQEKYPTGIAKIVRLYYEKLLFFFAN